MTRAESTPSGPVSPPRAEGRLRPRRRRNTRQWEEDQKAEPVVEGGGRASEAGSRRWTTDRTVRFAFNSDGIVHDVQLSRTPGQGTRSWQRGLQIPATTADTVRGIKHIYTPTDKKPVPLAYECSECGKVLRFDAPLAPSSFYVLGRNHLTNQHGDKAQKILDDTKPQGPIIPRATYPYTKKKQG